MYPALLSSSSPPAGKMLLPIPSAALHLPPLQSSFNSLKVAMTTHFTFVAHLEAAALSIIWMVVV